MSGDFLPEWNCIALYGRYRPIYRLYTGDNWHMVRDKAGPLDYASASEAIAASKAHVAGILNPAIRAERAFEKEAKAFRKARDTASGLIESVFGSAPKTVYSKGRSIPIERRGAKCR